jgi:phosphoserine phosphatase
MPAIDLILVRHGVTDWNEQGRLMGRLPIRLNARGRAQVAAAAQALADQRVDAVFASPQTRAQETADVIARQFGIEAQTDAALAEVWLGRWQGHRFDELQGDPDVARFLADPLHVCDAIEPATAVQARIVGFLEQLRANTAVRTAIAVSHGDPLRVLVAHVLGMALGGYRRLLIDPASVTRTRITESGGRILTLNWTPAGIPSAPRS